MLAIVAAVVVLGGGSGAAVCHYTSLNCEIGGLFFHKESAQQAGQDLINSVKSGSRVTGYFNDGLVPHVVLKNFTMPTDFAFITPERLLVSEKNGLVWEANLATHRRRVVLDLTKQIDTAFFRGVMTVTVDPDFAHNHFFYVLYSPFAGRGPQSAPTTARLTRFKLGATGLARDPHVLFGSVVGRSCSTLGGGADCLTADVDHLGAQIAFAPDGTLFVSTGDGGGKDLTIETAALRSQDVNALGGKVLHITRGGLGLPTNPFFDGNPRDNRSKVWAFGFRNPFRLARDPKTGTLIAGDVGSHQFDELDVIRRGANLGWPCFEGDVRHPLYASTPLCRKLYPRKASLTWPIKVAPSTTVIVAGTFLPKALARDIRATFLYGSFRAGWLRALTFSSRGLASTASVIAHGLPGPDAIHVDSRGHLYVLCFGNGDLIRVSTES